MPSGNQDIVRPIVFVGLGSSGAKIVSLLKRRIDMAGDDFTRQFYRYIRVTSEETPESGVDANIPGVILAQGSPTSDQAIAVFSSHAESGVRERFHKWWHKDADGQPWIPPSYSLKTGAGGVRSIGRLLLHYAQNRPGYDIATVFRSIRANIETTRAGLPDHERANVAGANAAFDCYVFGLLAGGTCSGSFLDLAFLIHQGMGPVNLYGAFLLGNICYDEISGARTSEQKPLKMEAQKQNTRYALAEMMLMGSSTGRQIVKDDWVRRIGATEITEALLTRYPFHSTAMIGARNDEGLPLRDFGDYLEFVADYYASLFVTEANARDIGRAVDEVVQANLQLEMDYPSRANMFERIGLLSVRAPGEKIRALIERDVALTIGIGYFKNSDPKKVDELVNGFKATMRREEILTSLAPTEDEIVPQEFDPVPRNAAELSDRVEQMKKDLDAFYGPWKERQSESLKTRLTEFQSTSTTAIDTLLRGTLGQGGAGNFSVGDLEATLKSLREDLAALHSQLDARSNDLGRQLNDDGELLAEKLANSATDFPTSGWFRLPRFRSWSGFGDILEILRKYRNDLRVLAATNAARAALAPLIAELETLSLVRKLLGNVAFQHSQNASEASDRLFNEPSQARGFRHEILSSREDILASFVTPLLDAPTHPPENPPVNQRARVCSLVASGWRSESGASLLDAFRELVALLRDHPDVKTPELAIDQVPKVRERARGLARGLTESFDRNFGQALVPELEKITVWDALRRYVRKVTDKNKDLDPQQVMLNLFRSYAERLKPFTRLSATAGRDPFALDIQHYFVCDEAAAAKCFDELDIPNPGTYLQQLLMSTFGGNYEPLQQARSTGQELLLFTRQRGDLPIFYEGHEAVAELLSASPPEATNKRRHWYWTDRRFPEWIQKWHKKNPRPYLLNDDRTA